MLIENSFHVDLSVDEAWRVLSDLPRIAPCMPGAELTEIDGDQHHGVVKVKVGSITTQYRGTATVQRADADSRVLVVDARGHETRGQGRASATITAELAPDAAGTTVKVATDLQISGRVAQFGRGVLQDVSTKLIAQFVDALQQEVAGTPGRGVGREGGANTDPDSADEAGREAGDGSAPSPTAHDVAADGGPAARSPVPMPPRSAVEPVDLLALGGPSLARRLAPVVATIAALLVLVAIVRRRPEG